MFYKIFKMNKLTKEDYEKVKSFNDMLELEYGLLDTPDRDEFEKNSLDFIALELLDKKTFDKSQNTEGVAKNK
jgi:hypothetical protein